MTFLFVSISLLNVYKKQFLFNTKNLLLYKLDNLLKIVLYKIKRIFKKIFAIHCSLFFYYFNFPYYFLLIRLKESDKIKEHTYLRKNVYMFGFLLITK